MTCGLVPTANGVHGKYLIASIDQSLVRMGLDYVDIFYSHRPDPETPLEETMGALDRIVRSGKALYVGLSNYSPEQTRQSSQILPALGNPCLLHQPRYNMFDRRVEGGLLETLKEERHRLRRLLTTGPRPFNGTLSRRVSRTIRGWVKRAGFSKRAM